MSLPNYVPEKLKYRSNPFDTYSKPQRDPWRMNKLINSNPGFLSYLRSLPEEQRDNAMNNFYDNDGIVDYPDVAPRPRRKVYADQQVMPEFEKWKEKTKQRYTPYVFDNTDQVLDRIDRDIDEHPEKMRQRWKNKWLNIVSIGLSLGILVPIFLLLFEDKIFSKSLVLRKKNSNILNYGLFGMLAVLTVIMVINGIAIALPDRYVSTSIAILLFCLLYLAGYLAFTVEAFQYGNESIDTIVLTAVFGLYLLAIIIMFFIILRS